MIAVGRQAPESWEQGAQECHPPPGRPCPISHSTPHQYHISPRPRSSEKQSLPCQFRVSLSSCPGRCKLAPDKVPGSCKLVQGLIALQGKVTREAGRCWSHVLPRRGGPSGPLPLLHPPASLRRGRVLSWESAIRSLLRVCKGSRSRKAQAEQGWVGVKAAACPPPFCPLLPRDSRKAEVRRAAALRKTPPLNAGSFPVGTERGVRSWGIYFLYYCVCATVVLALL